MNTLLAQPLIAEKTHDLDYIFWVCAVGRGDQHTWRLGSRIAKDVASHIQFMGAPLCERQGLKYGPEHHRIDMWLCIFDSLRHLDSCGAATKFADRRHVLIKVEAEEQICMPSLQYDRHKMLRVPGPKLFACTLFGV
jgi:hypothetical protein